MREWRSVVLFVLPWFSSSVILSQDAHATSSAPKPRTTVLLATMVNPGDSLPVDLTMEHQQQALSSVGTELREVVVIDNRPPWGPRETPHEESLKRLEASGVHRVRADYTQLSDAGYLKRFFKIRSMDGDEVTISKLFPPEAPGKAKAFKDMFGRLYFARQHLSSNFLGMLRFLEECLRASSVDLCMYLDADVLLHRNSSKRDTSLVDLAAELFRQNTDVIQLEPPNICHYYEEHGECRLTSQKDGDHDYRSDAKALTSRHMIIHRKRLQDALPLAIDEKEVQGMGFEQVWTRSIQAKATPRCRQKVPKVHSENTWTVCTMNTFSGHMHCPFQTFAIHPPSLGMDASWLVRETFNATGGTGGEERDGAFSKAVTQGTKTLLKRMETGRFASLPAKKRHEARPTVLNPVAAGCVQMVANEDRIKKGLAW